MNSHVDKPKAQLENLSIRPCSVDDLETLSGLEAVTNLTTEGGGVGLQIGADGVALDVIGNVHRMFDVMVQGGTCNVYDSLLSVRTGSDAEVINEKGVTGINDAEADDLAWAQGAVSALDGRVSVLELNADVLVSASDVDTAVTVLSKMRQIITGTGVLQMYTLPNATALGVGKHYEIINQTREFIGLHNSDNSCWHRIPPYGRLELDLVDNSTLQGVWAGEVVQTKNPAVGLDQLCEFTGLISSNYSYSDPAWIAAVSGTGAQFISSAYQRDGHIGIGELQAGTAANGYCTIHPTGGDFFLGAAAHAMEVLLSYGQPSTETDSFVSRIGIHNNSTGGAPTSGVYLLYDKTTYPNGYALRTLNTSSSETIETNVVPKVWVDGWPVYQKARVEISSQLARADFWIDNAQLSPSGGMHSYLPLSTHTMRHRCSVTNTLGTGAGRRLDVDYIRQQSYPTTRR